MYKVLLADDNALSRKAVRQSVSWKNNGCKIVGEAENGVKACQMIRELRPDIVLMDIRMPGMTGLEAIRCLKGEGIDSLYILITAYDDFAFAKEGIQLGVFDLYLKTGSRKRAAAGDSESSRRSDAGNTGRRKRKAQASAQ